MEFTVVMNFLQTPCRLPPVARRVFQTGQVFVGGCVPFDSKPTERPSATRVGLGFKYFKVVIKLLENKWMSK